MRSAEFAHKPHTKDRPSDRDIAEFWVWIHHHAPAAKRELMESDDIEAWARRQHLHKDGAVLAWLLESAQVERDAFSKPHPPNLVTVCVGSVQPSPVRLRPALGPGNTADEIYDGPPSWGYYLPQWSRRASVKRSIMAELDRQVEKELNRLDREHSPGPPRRKRSQHFDWALRFQIIGHSVPDIATTLRNGDGDERTINAAIDQVLDTLGFSRRPPRFLRRPKLGN